MGGIRKGNNQFTLAAVAALFAIVLMATTVDSSLWSATPMKGKAGKAGAPAKAPPIGDSGKGKKRSQSGSRKGDKSSASQQPQSGGQKGYVFGNNAAAKRLPAQVFHGEQEPARQAWTNSRMALSTQG